jgi:CheY-like chemotaxis protein
MLFLNMETSLHNGPLKILLADDDKDDCFFFEKALKGLPIETCITTFNDGEQLMAYLAENPEFIPDILFLDLNMPRKNGFECLSEIKENKKAKDFPVVMFSTSYPRDVNYEQGIINTLYNIGAVDFIRKPNDIEKLQEVIQQSLTKLMKNKWVSQ